jgi:hypothetical protein
MGRNSNQFESSEREETNLRSKHKSEKRQRKVGRREHPTCSENCERKGKLSHLHQHLYPKREKGV